MTQQAVIVVGAISIDGEPPRPCVISGMATAQAPAGGAPSHPIYFPPVISGGPINPYPDIGFPGPQPGGPVYPWGPIIYPDQGLPIPQPPSGGGGPGKWQWVYSPVYGWVLDPGLGGKPQPPGGAGSAPGSEPHPEHQPA